MIRILIADDHTVVRKGLRQILSEQMSPVHIEEVGDAESLIKKVMSETWDVIITDLSMPGRSGLDALQQIKQYYPKLPVLVLSVYPEEQYALRVLKAGAAGYLNKDMASEELINAVQRVLTGRKYISPSVAEKLAVSLDKDASKMPHEYLSDREFDVLKLIASGNTVTQIADILSLSSTTVSTYRARIMSKMSLKTNTSLTLYAMENKII
jgi:two-component system, NarL family, invasion response regulator UvrY